MKRIISDFHRSLTTARAKTAAFVRTLAARIRGKDFLRVDNIKRLYQERIKGVAQDKQKDGYINPLEVILKKSYRDIRAVFSEPGTRLLDASILIFFAFLPFHLVRFHLPIFGLSVKYTEIAFIFIGIFGVYAFFRGRITIRKSYWLYVFLGLHAFVQFFSAFFAPYGVETWDPAIAAASYSVILFILINVIRSQRLIRVILHIMGLSVLIVVVHSLFLYIIQDFVFQTRLQPSIIGNDIGNYLGYLLVMFGVGVVFILFEHYRRKESTIAARILALCLVIAWMYVLVLSGIKIAHISTAVFLLLLVIFLKGSRFLSLGLFCIFVIIFLFQFNIVLVQNTYRITADRIDQSFNEWKENVIDSANNAGDYILAALSREPEANGELAQRFAQNGTQGVGVAPFIPPDPFVAIPETEVLTPIIAEVVTPPSIETPKPFASSQAPPLGAKRPEFDNKSVTQDSPFVDRPPLPRKPPAPAMLESENTNEEQEPRKIFSGSGTPSDGLLGSLSEENFVQARYLGGNGAKSIQLRVRGMLAAYSMGLRYPLTGVGPGEQMYFFDHFSEVIREMRYRSSILDYTPKKLRRYIVTSDKWTISQSNPNNIFLMAWAETGILGLIALSGILGLIVFKGIVVLWRHRTDHALTATRICVLSLISLLLFQLINPFILHPWLWTTLALAYVSSVDIDHGEQKIA